MSLAALRESRRALLIGLGGGGDVVGAFALTSLLERLGTDWIVGGVAWERSPIDPEPGPRSLEEIRGGRLCGSAAVLADAETTNADGVHFSESRMAGHLDRPTLLLDITRGPVAVANGLAEAAMELDCDLVVVVDVGGDVLAHGGEPGLASPLCDAIMLSAAAWLTRAETRSAPGPAWQGEVIAAVYGPGCDGELTPSEVLERIGGLGAAEALLGAWGLTPEACELVEAAAEVVPTEASLQAVRCARGERGMTYIRSGRRRVELTPLGALTFFFDPVKAVDEVAPLAAAVGPAVSLDEANEALKALGVGTELELERARARGEIDAGARE
ncbi:MAG TPA: DUF1152 domain-containing protein [Solirubrobacterales bacterium]|nr:DUF1152 domain-containing protein [Solirubrobacterales bacterium]